MILLISYDLHKPKQEYAELYEKIKNIGSTWWHYLDSVWLVDTNLSPQDVWESLTPAIDKDDYVFVTRVSADPGYSGWLPQKAWDWLKVRAF